MNTNNVERVLSWVLSFALVASTTPLVLGYQASNGPQGNNTGTDTAQLSSDELHSLVAPIALYPDPLVAQILTASTFPDQVAVANYWVQQNKNLTGNALMQAVDKQAWDPSVKALTQFPSVLDNLAKNLTWASSLGEAYHNQQSEVMTAIQTLRAQAKSAGNLKSGSQVTVVQQTPETIVIQPANPQIVYVPQYNPAVVYGTPYVTPGYSAGDVAAAGIIGFGAGIAVGALMSSGGGCCSWGWSSWNCGWHGTAVVYHGGSYYGNSAWHGGYYNSGYHNNYGYNRVGNNYNSYRGGSNYKNVSGNTINVNNRPNSHSQSFGSDRSSSSSSWAQHDNWAQHNNWNSGRSNAFSGLDGHSGGFGNSGGWFSRAQSDRGWGSMRSSGFSGGRFGGGGFGGGGFRGGGFRR